MQDLSLGRRRRLLGLKGDIKQKAAMGAFKAAMGSFSLGFGKGIFSLTKSTLGAASMSFSNADFSVLLASQDPTFMLGAHTSAPAVAWAHYTYGLCSNILVDIVSSIYMKNELNAAVIWVDLHDSKAKYDAIIGYRVRQGCLGIRLMLGYTSGMAEALYFNCLSAADMIDGSFSLALLLFAEAPLYRCACVSSVGQDFVPYIQQNCMQLVPAAKKALWQQLLAGAGDNSAGVCSSFETDLHTQAVTAFDVWAKDSILAAEALASFLQDLLVPNQGQQGQCAVAKTNPAVLALMPLPIDHFRVCGKTSGCRLKCADAFDVFDYEMLRYKTLYGRTNVGPRPYDLQVESPLFNAYAGASSSSYIPERIVAIASRDKTAGRACATCQEGGSCVHALTTPWGEGASALKATTYCLPPPTMITATIYPTGVGTWRIALPTSLPSGSKLTFADFALQYTQQYVLLYYSSTQQSASSSSRSGVIHQMHVFTESDGSSELVLHTDTLLAELLTPAVAAATFGQAVLGAEPISCTIAAVLEVATSKPGQLVFFVKVDHTASAWQGFAATDTQQNSQMMVMTGAAHLIVTWCDSAISAASCVSSTRVYPPCSACGDSCEACNPHLDLALELAGEGVMLHVRDSTYLFIPDKDAVENDLHQMMYVRVDPYGLNTSIGLPPPIQYQGAQAVVRMMVASASQATLGTWTRADIFSDSTSVAGQRRVRSASLINNATLSPIRWLEVAKPTQASSQWLAEARVERASNGWTITLRGSQSANVTAVLITNCSAQTCMGCPSARMRLMCHALQDCVLSNCIGTLVNARSVMCGVGILMQKGYLQAVATWRAMYILLAEMGMYVLNGAAEGSAAQKLVLSLPTDNFYDLVCTCKDLFAGISGLGISVMQMMAGAQQMGRIDFGMDSDLNVAQTETMAKATSLGALAFNMVTASTLFPVLALHRWMLCVANVSTPEDIAVLISFGDISMDTSWGKCMPAGNLAGIIDSTDSILSKGVQNTVISFTEYALTLMTGIGETVLSLILLMYDCTIDILVGVVWGVQNVMFIFNMRNCKVPDASYQAALFCSCGDSPYSIPPAQRGQDKGALWCTGTLSMTLLDGSTGLIYNPYTMQQLSTSLSGLTAYIRCLGTTTGGTVCPRPASQGNLKILTSQNVEPIAVWARCKSNYMMSSWDIGAGALYLPPDSSSSTLSAEVIARRHDAIAWATSVSPDFLSCMQNPSRLHVDYSACMTMYIALTLGRAPQAYYIYLPHSDPQEPPDACMVFTGLNKSASAGGPLQQQMNDCIMSTNQSTVENCQFNPAIWSTSSGGSMPVAKMHGTVPSVNTSRAKPASAFYPYYAGVVQGVRAAFDRFWTTFEQQAPKIESMLFSADGDFIHDMLDCIFMGPYSRVDMLPCDMDGVLECPFYARDNASGGSRNFTDCYGAELRGDSAMPFTCGSQARRAIIKYFYRNYSSLLGNNSGLTAKVIGGLRTRLQQLQANYTNVSSYGCYNATTGVCSPTLCTLENGFTPCVDSNFAMTSVDVSKILMSILMSNLKGFYDNVTQDTLAWATHYNASGGAQWPAQWGGDAYSANAAQHEGALSPDKPVVTYGPDEAYSMPYLEAGATLDDRVAGGPWGLCMTLLTQGAMTLPMMRMSDGRFRPLGTDELKYVDLQNPDAVAALVRNVTAAAMTAGVSSFWHNARRHAPSESAVCTRSQDPTLIPKRRRLAIEDPAMILGDSIFIAARVQRGASLPIHGFLWGSIGGSHHDCICGWQHPEQVNMCALDTTVCAVVTLPPSERCAPLRDACTAAGGTYPRAQTPAIWECLHAELPGLKCEELGPSDSWGLFPVDCTSTECAIASSWVSQSSSADVDYQGIRFVTEGRAGMRLSNFQIVNATFNSSLHYSQQKKQPWAYQQANCFTPSQLSKGPSENEMFDVAQNVIKGLFPAAQLTFESPVSSACTRYLVEIARAQAMSFVSEEQAEAANQQAEAWARRCHAKIRHLAACNRMGVYFEQRPPADIWPRLAERRCPVTVQQAYRDTLYLTPWCILVDRKSRLMYDAVACASMGTAEQQQELTRPWVEARCYPMAPQPLSLLADPESVPPATTVYTDGRRLSDTILTELISSFGLQAAQREAQPDDVGYEHVSHILDWWPEEEIPLPPGFHVTSAMALDEFAPVLFDSHYAYDQDLRAAHYVHTSLRNGSLLYNTAGGGGICRMHSVGMPIVDTNTNRICTREAKSANADTPTLPVSSARGPPGIPLMGPYSESTLNQYFGPEMCAESFTDVPWAADADDALSSSAGAIMGFSSYVTMDSGGEATYSLDSPTFPPAYLKLSTLKGAFDDGWGPSCAPVWGVSPPCMDNITASDQGCPANTICLRTSADSPEGICMSTAVHRADRSRVPCFRSFHCPDGTVCLVDGGCSPLTMHVWNDDRAGMESMEFAVLAERCGFQSDVHPATQSMRGASPWEQVPDLLSVHGMCSHREWFAYRNAMQRQVCSGTGQVRECNASEAAWPWVHMRFDGTRLSDVDGGSVAPQTMGQGPAVLQSIAHPCDDSMLHSAASGGRLKVCTGFQGQQRAAAGAYWQYELNTNTQTWEGADMQSTMLPNITRWMRTFDEQSGAVHVGALDFEGGRNKTLGFLGANLDSPTSRVADAMAKDGGKQVSFFRCADRIACSIPEYTFNGVQVQRVDSWSGTANLTEMSLRLCGPIGFLITTPAAATITCRLDHALFPLLAVLLWQQQDTTTSRRGCQGIWDIGTYLPQTAVQQIPTMIDATTLYGARLRANPGVLFCTPSDDGGGCVYLARPTPDISKVNPSTDSVTMVTRTLNGMWQDATRLITSVAASAKNGGGAMRAYEDVNLCLASVLQTNRRTQQLLADAYGSQGTSGIYIALRLSLKETPLHWMHQCLLTVILATVDRGTTAPDTSLLTTSAVSFDMWSPKAATICAESTLLSKPALLALICKQLHPTYTFTLQRIDSPSLIASALQTAVVQQAQTSLFDTSSTVAVTCATTAHWACVPGDTANSACGRAIAAAYASDCESKQQQQQQLPDWHECSLTEAATSVFAFGGLVDVTVQELQQMQGGTMLQQYLVRATDAIIGGANQTAFASSFVTANWQELVDGPGQGKAVGVVQVQGIDLTSLPSGFSVEQWSGDACHASLPTIAEGACIAGLDDQLSPRDMCLLGDADQYQDADRYFDAAEPPALLMTYADSSTQSVPICNSRGGMVKVMQSAIATDQYDKLICSIQGIDVPPGVRVAAFSGSKTSADWATFMASLNYPSQQQQQASVGFKSCAWNEATVPGWWPAARFSSDPPTSPFAGYSVDLTAPGDWWKGGDAFVWDSEGCGLFQGACAVVFELDVTAHTQPACVNMAGRGAFTQFSSNMQAFASITQEALTCPPTLRPFRMRETFNAFALWICAKCTPFRSLAMQGKDLRMNCSMHGRTPFSAASLNDSFPFLYHPVSLLQQAGDIAQEGDGFTVGQSTTTTGTTLQVLATLAPSPFTVALAGWANNNVKRSCQISTASAAESAWQCFALYDPSTLIANEDLVWDKAVANPASYTTMSCEGQRYSINMQTQCNSRLDGRRKTLEAFVDTQYRSRDGVWLQRVPSGQGVAWVANVASSKASDTFTLYYTSGDRQPASVISRWITSDGPCADNQKSWLSDRICVESIMEAVGFEPVHPWVGGDFNPLLPGVSTGLDQCPYNQQGASSSTSVCPCKCAPQWACEGRGFNYSDDFMALEFQQQELCMRQGFSTARVMDPNDAGNLCSQVQRTVVTAATASCTHQQGGLGGSKGRPVSTPELHSRAGVASTLTVAQQLLPDSLDDTSHDSQLWAGGLTREASPTAASAFLAMPLQDLHPAHIAFGIDVGKAGKPLVVRGISLLPGSPSVAMQPSAWVPGLVRAWKAELAGTILDMYPQLSTSTTQKTGDWSCPLRRAAFVGGATAQFGPLTPNPILASSLFNLGGAHPFIRPSPLYASLSEYATVNGACLYSSTNNQGVPIADASSSCGIKGLLLQLFNGGGAISSVQEPFDQRCPDVMDAPDTGGGLRTGEKLPPLPGRMPRCGLMHRLSPFFIRVNGNAGAVKARAGISTSDEGGDCHMGRAVLASIGLLQGKACALAFKNRTHAYTSSLCGKQLLSRAAPWTLEQVLARSTRVYRASLRLIPGGSPYPVFIGPGGTPTKHTLPQREVSFGQLYSVSLAEALASDLIDSCIRLTPGCSLNLDGSSSWLAKESFVDLYMNGSLTLPGQTTTTTTSTTKTTAEERQTRLASQTEAARIEQRLWAGQWAWSFMDKQASPVGAINRTDWLRDRTGTCNASFQALLGTLPVGFGLNDRVLPIPLCSPAPTGGLQALCASLQLARQQSTDISGELFGEGAYISNPGMFYLPYMWSGVNQEYVGVTVTSYYRRVVALYPNETFSSLCSTGESAYLTTLAALSRAQNAACPAVGMEVFKDLLAILKTAGHALLRLGYNCVMFIATMLAAVFDSKNSNAGFYFNQAGEYLVEAVQLISEFLMPFLNAIINVLFNHSDAGRVIMAILTALCETFNFLLKYWFAYIWCTILQPVVMSILMFIQVIAQIAGNSGLSSSIGAMLNTGVLSSPSSCVAAVQRMQLQCRFSTEHNNTGAFEAQPIATQCWASWGGGGVLTGAQSLLTCTSSDTCARDPLLFDATNSEGLISCGSCPSIDTEQGQRFGCDTYLKRCICGVPLSATAPCMSNADCSAQLQAPCSVASTIQGARASFVTITCDRCAGLGMEPVCAIDGHGTAGVCACASMRSTLQSCQGNAGQMMHVLGSTQQCAVVLDTQRQKQLKGSVAPAAITLEFQDLAITMCAIGSYQNLCMRVDMPLSSAAGVVETELVVLLGMNQAPITFTGRRLLAPTIVDGIDGENEALFVSYCGEAIKNNDNSSSYRTELKRCFECAMLARVVVDHFNLSAAPDVCSLQGLMLAAPQAVSQGWLLYAMQQHPRLRTLATATEQLADFFALIMRFPRSAPNPHHARTLLQQDVVIEPPLPPTTATTSAEDDVGVCSFIGGPLQSAAFAFWITVSYYRERQSPNEDAPRPACNLTAENPFACTLSSLYTLPPASFNTSTTSSMPSSLSEAFLYAPTMGYGINRTLDAAFSTMSYNESLANQYITGRRIVQDLSSCNYTRLTMGPEQPYSLFITAILTCAVCGVLTAFCSVCSLWSLVIWLFLFPLLFFWGAYNISPLCFPMIPPRLPADVYNELNALVPSHISIPRQLLADNCTRDGISTITGEYSPDCFMQCTEAPFMFKSWQDTVTWWLCEISTESCFTLANVTQRLGGAFQDVRSSADYYAEVLSFSKSDPEFVYAHRVCALFTLHQVALSLCWLVFLVLVFPSVVTAIMEVFMGALVLLLDSYSSAADT